MLLIVALFGLVVPNGFFLKWLITEYDGIGPVMRDHLAMGFILDALLAVAILAVYFARRPIGRYRWPWFVGLSLVGGLGFSLPMYWWMNQRGKATATDKERDARL